MTDFTRDYKTTINIGASDLFFNFEPALDAVSKSDFDTDGLVNDENLIEAANSFAIMTRAMGHDFEIQDVMNDFLNRL